MASSLEAHGAEELTLAHTTSPTIESTPAPLTSLELQGPTHEPDNNPPEADYQRQQQYRRDNNLLRVQSHNPAMKIALKTLISNAISLVEYGSQLQYRYGAEDPLIVVEWAVPDEELLFASQYLLELDFPRLYGNETEWLGIWDERCWSHSLDDEGRMRVHLLPLTLVGFTLKDTLEVPSTFAHELCIRTPKPLQYMLSLIKHLLQLPLGEGSRLRVEQDLGRFVSAFVLQEACSVDESEKKCEKSIEDGVRLMKEWDWSVTEERYRVIAERVVRDRHYIEEMTDQQLT